MQNSLTVDNIYTSANPNLSITSDRPSLVASNLLAWNLLPPCFIFTLSVLNHVSETELFFANTLLANASLDCVLDNQLQVIK